MSEDKDIKVLEQAFKALNGSTSRRMLIANFNFLYDRFIRHPSPDLPEHLREGEPQEPRPRVRIAHTLRAVALKAEATGSTPTPSE